MACFIVPMTQVVVTTVMRKRMKKGNSSNPWLSQLPKLELMLWGGTVMLIIDHLLNGELTWQYPFFTAMQQESGIMTMLQEMLTVGLPMSLSVTMIYCIMVSWKDCLAGCMALLQKTNETNLRKDNYQNKVNGHERFYKILNPK